MISALAATRQTYTYRGGPAIREGLRGQTCRIIVRPDGKCARWRNGNMLVEWTTGPEAGRMCVVVGRLLRKGAPQ